MSNDLPHWIYIERQWSTDLVVGPYPSEDAAATAMEDAPLIDAFCMVDALDCYLISTDPTPEVIAGKLDGAIADLNDPDHTGVGEREDDTTGPLRLMTYEFLPRRD